MSGASSDRRRFALLPSLRRSHYCLRSGNGREAGRRSAAGLLRRDEAGQIAVNFTKPPELLQNSSV
jgi:hypothetical protein